MKKTVSLVIVDHKGHYKADVYFQGISATVEGSSETELKKLARVKLIEEDEIKEHTEITWDVKWN